MSRRWPLSRKATELIDAFGKSAMHHGWQAAVGIGSEPEKAERAYLADKVALERLVKGLESRLRIRTREVKDLGKELEDTVSRYASQMGLGGIT